jgi:hypothetical protein
MIEIAQQTKHVITYGEALLYCQFLDYNDHSDWRLPTGDEYIASNLIWGWYQDKPMLHYCSVTPVRDI